MEGLRHRPEGRPPRASMTDNRRTPSSQTPRDSQQDLPTHTVVVPNSIDMVSVLGPGDEHLRLIERAFDATVHVRGNRITLAGDSAEVAMAERLLDEVVTLVRTGQGITGETVERIIQMLRTETQERPAEVLSLNILSNRGRTIRPKTLNQKRYVESIDNSTITFGIGPAGTGKTYLAMAKAVQALQAKEVNRIILSRPAVEAGERLGLPARHAQREDRPLPAPALRRAARHGRPRDHPQAARRRHHRGRPAGVPPRPLAQRLLHHPRRGAEHDARADEDVPDPPRLRLADRGHRRHQPGRPPVGDQVGPAGRGGDPRRRRGHLLLPPHRHRRRTPPAGRSHRGGLRGLRRPAPVQAQPHDQRPRTAPTKSERSTR